VGQHLRPHGPPFSATFLNSGCPIIAVALWALPQLTAKPLAFGRHGADKNKISSRNSCVYPLRGSPDPRRADGSPLLPASSISIGSARHSFRLLFSVPAPPVRPQHAPVTALQRAREISLSYLEHSPSLQRLKRLVDDQAPGITPAATCLPRLVRVVCLDSSHVGSSLKSGSSQYVRASRPGIVSRAKAHFMG